MLYKVIGFLFSRDDYQRNSFKIGDLFWAVILLAAGVFAFVDETWWLFGVVLFLMGIALALTIILGMNWDKAIEYWETLDSFAKTMMKANNPDLWQALGFKHPPAIVEVIEKSEANKDHGFSMKFHKLPVSPAVMQVIADKILSSGKMEFPVEGSPLASSIPNYRKVKDYLKKEGYIIKTNNKNVRLGYSFNKKGVDTLYQFASEGVKLRLKERNGHRRTESSDNT